MRISDNKNLFYLRYDQAPDDCNEWANNCDPFQDDPNGDGGRCCHYDTYRRFVGLKEQNPNFVPMISIGKPCICIVSINFNNSLHTFMNRIKISKK